MAFHAVAARTGFVASRPFLGNTRGLDIVRRGDTLALLALESLVTARVVGTASFPILGAISLALEQAHLLLRAFERPVAILAAIGVVTLVIPFGNALRKFDTDLTIGFGNTCEPIAARSVSAIGILLGVACRDVAALMISIVEFDTGKISTAFVGLTAYAPFEEAFGCRLFAKHLGANYDTLEVATAVSNVAFTMKSVAGESECEAVFLGGTGCFETKYLVIHDADVIGSAKVNDFLAHVVNVLSCRVAEWQVAVHEVIKRDTGFVYKQRFCFGTEAPVVCAVLVAILSHTVSQRDGNINMLARALGPVVPGIPISTSQETRSSSINVWEVDADIDEAAVGISKGDNDLEFSFDVHNLNFPSLLLHGNDDLFIYV